MQKFYEGIINDPNANHQRQKGPEDVELINQDFYINVTFQQTANYIESNCAEIAFYNNAPTATGATMIVNGITFPPNTGISFGGNRGETDTSKYVLSFGSTGTPLAVIIRKYYTNK